MAARLRIRGRFGQAASIGGAALFGLLAAAPPAFAQGTAQQSIGQERSEDGVQFGTGEFDAPSARDRRPLGEGRSILFRDANELTTDERELLRELYREGSSIDRLDGEEYGRPDPDAEQEIEEFDVFAGPERGPQSRAATADNRPALAAPAAGQETRDQFGAPIDPDQVISPDGFVSDGSEGDDAGRAAPAGRIADDDRSTVFANPPLAAGVSGEVPGSNSLLEPGIPARAIERIARRPLEDRPFDPIGLRVGTLTIYPELYQGAGYSTNLDERAGGEAGAFSETEVNIRAITDWLRNEAELNARINYRRNFGGEKIEDPFATLDGRIGLEFGAFTTAALRGALAYRKDDEIDLGPGLPGEEPEVLTSSISAEVSHEIARTTLTGGLVLAREHYLSKPAGLPDLDYTTATARIRAAYEVSPALAPFVEASVGRRMFDETGLVDGDATIPAVRAGLGLDIAEKLSGEIALGYASSIPEDGPTTGAPTIDANLVWSPQRGTDLLLEARTTFQPDGSGGSDADYDASIALIHAINSRLDLNGALRAEIETNDETSDTPLGLAAEVGFTYWLNRSLAFSGLYEYRTRHEADPAFDWSANTVSLGVTLQR